MGLQLWIRVVGRCLMLWFALSSSASAAEEARRPFQASIRILIDEQGKVTRATVDPKYASIAAFLESDALQRKFQPATLDGKPANSELTMHYGLDVEPTGTGEYRVGISYRTLSLMPSVEMIARVAPTAALRRRVSIAVWVEYSMSRTQPDPSSIIVHGFKADWPTGTLRTLRLNLAKAMPDWPKADAVVGGQAVPMRALVPIQICAVPSPCIMPERPWTLKSPISEDPRAVLPVLLDDVPAQPASELEPSTGGAESRRE